MPVHSFSFQTQRGRDTEVSFFTSHFSLRKREFLVLSTFNQEVRMYCSCNGLGCDLLGGGFALSEIFVFTTNREMNRSFEMQFVFCILPLKNQRNNNIYYIFFVPLHGIMIFIGIWTGRRTMADGVSDQ